ncbi:hypothetical protein [Ensifer sp. LCM 4579]|uniref:hypothetical protein n=1 Tax=Ensifer sp. LCM 4579 TaxID=1848292 RepID=UPI0008DA1C76|nr:hypothetical protein [Ensifer sp. LCM 4579]OHV73343.1 hypothetical protein LCM4579_10505 [Ensifer sp. LCM 4579]
MTDKRISQAARMWRDGHRTEEIAHAIGFSASALRSCIALNPDLFPRRSIKQIEARATVKSPAPPPKAPGYEGVPYGRLTACGCQFPLWEDHERYNAETSLWCGAPRAEDRPYCGFHANKAVGPGTRSEREATRTLRKMAA